MLKEGGPLADLDATQAFVDALSDMVHQPVDDHPLADATQYADASDVQQRDLLTLRGVPLDAEQTFKQRDLRTWQGLLNSANRVSPDVGMRLSAEAAASKQEFLRTEIQQMNTAAAQDSLFTIESATLAALATQPLNPGMQHVEAGLQGAAGVVTEIPAVLYDLAQVAYGVAHTELTGQVPDLTLRSGQGMAAQGGAGTGELLQNMNPAYSFLVGQYEVREALARGDTQPLAAIGAGILTGAAMGRMMPSVPGYRPGGAAKVANAADAIAAESGGAAFGGNLYPPKKLRQLVSYLERRGVSVYGTEGNPRFLARADGTGMMELPANPTELQVKHELSHYLDFKQLGYEGYRDLGGAGPLQARYLRESSVLERLQQNRIWNQMNQAEKDFSTNYVERLRNGVPNGN